MTNANVEGPDCVFSTRPIQGGSCRRSVPASRIADVLHITEEVGLDIAQLRRDMEALKVVEHIQTAMSLTQAQGFNGTLSFVIGDAARPRAGCRGCRTVADARRQGAGG